MGSYLWQIIKLRGCATKSGAKATAVQTLRAHGRLQTARSVWTAARSPPLFHPLSQTAKLPLFVNGMIQKNFSRPYKFARQRCLSGRSKTFMEPCPETADVQSPEERSVALAWLGCFSSLMLTLFFQEDLFDQLDDSQLVGRLKWLVPLLATYLLLFFGSFARRLAWPVRLLKSAGVCCMIFLTVMGFVLLVSVIVLCFFLFFKGR